MPKRAITSDKVFKGSLPFAQATVAGGFMFVCCVGLDRSGQFAVGDVRAQTQACLDNICALIEAAGGTMRDIVKCTVYVTDRANWPAVWRTCVDFWAEHCPDINDRPRAGTLLTNVGLDRPDMLIEIEAIAYRKPGHQRLTYSRRLPE